MTDEKPKEQPMLWFLPKRVMLFQRDEVKEGVQIVHDQFKLIPNKDERNPVQAPAWIKETEFYKLLKKDKAILETEAPESEEEFDKPQKAGAAGLPKAWQK